MAKLEWLGHASFRITDDVTIYIDPWKLTGTVEPADLVLISHSHDDHFSADDLEKLRKPDTLVIASTDVAGKLGGRVCSMKPGDALAERGVHIRASAAYNREKEFHPKANHWLGFLVRIGGETIYYAGDTDVIPEMSQLGPVDIALLPVGGTYTMGPTEAAEAASIINAGRYIPYHYGDIVGSEADARRFRSLCTARTEILQVAE